MKEPKENHIPFRTIEELHEYVASTADTVKEVPGLRIGEAVQRRLTDEELSLSRIDEYLQIGDQYFIHHINFGSITKLTPEEVESLKKYKLKVRKVK